AFWSGLVLLMLSSTGLEYTRLYRFESLLPGHHAGGILGFLVGGSAAKWLGFNGSALVFIVFMLVGLSWTFGFSWVQLSENIGSRIDQALTDWRERREMAEDLAMGQAAAKEREQDMHSDFGDSLELTPRAVRIVVEPEPLVAPKSERMARERQKPLFNDMPDSRLPQVDLLDDSQAKHDPVDAETIEFTSRLIEKKLRDFGVEVKVLAAAPGPVVTRYEIEPATGVKGSQIVNLAKDLARSLSMVSIRVVETIPGKNFMALELPNAKRQSIRLSEILGSEVYNEAKSMLTMGLGKDIGGHPVVADLAKMPHVLVAGTTGSGKSVGINAMILSLLYKAEARDVRLLMIDPKMLEMSVYEGIPHLLAPVVTDMRQAAHGLNWCVGEMERRYKLMSKLGVRNLAGYNHKIEEALEAGHSLPNPFSLTPDDPEPLERLPHIVVVIDELADLMMVVGKKIEELIARLAQKARAAGIHLILATQRPSVDVITGLIKANIPTRIAFQVSSKIDSRTILDQMGAEALLGMGDMLYLPSGTGFPIRVHGAFVSDEEVHRVVSYLKTQGEPNYIEGLLEGGTVDGDGSGPDLFGDTASEKDPMYDQAVEVVLKNRKASISLVQRHLKIGYNRAARLVEDMEKAGMVSAMSSNGQREILVPTRQE
ncbi:MAG: DNA translocase FtsK, partial [Limnohabitans sp.]